jgi:hypothetical protein
VKGVEAVITKTVVANMERLLSRLNEMPLADIMHVFHNAVSIVADPDKQSLHDSARRTLAAIDREWERRAEERPRPVGFFEWPDTDAPGGDGRLNTQEWLAEGLLAFMGYHVGRTNDLPTRYRRALLSEIFTSHLPPVFPSSYLDEWGMPSSAPRLQKMAESLAAYTRNAKRKRLAGLDDAIRDWEHDLRFLYETYYVRHFRFAWPSNELP